MSTRGVYGFRKNGKDMITYNHSDSYPDYLGYHIVKFINDCEIKKLNDIADRIIMVQDDGTPTERQIAECKSNRLFNNTVSTMKETDWYCLLRNLQGNFKKYKEITGNIYMINSSEFLKDTLFCEYGYIIDLDNNVLEFYNGEEEPTEIWKFEELYDADAVVEKMNGKCEDEENLENYLPF